MKKQQMKTSKAGFTIIEVVLVLAIAGLIFLMVFVALPALQRSQRDTQRKNDYSTISASVESYVANNSGKLPTAATGLASYYGNLVDPSTNTAYTVEIKDGASVVNVSSTPGSVYVVTHAKCDGNTKTATDKSRSYVVLGYSESGGFCIGS